MTVPSAADWFTGATVNDALIDTNQTAYIQQALDAVADSGYATSGITAAGAATSGTGGGISGVELRTVGPWVIIQGVIVIGSTGAISVPSDGNVSNTQVAQITDSSLFPSVPQCVGSGSAGPNARFQINTLGHVNIVSIDSGATLNAADTCSFDGRYLL